MQLNVFPVIIIHYSVIIQYLHPSDEYLSSNLVGFILRATSRLVKKRQNINMDKHPKSKTPQIKELKPSLNYIRV